MMNQMLLIWYWMMLCMLNELIWVMMFISDRVRNILQEMVWVEVCRLLSRVNLLLFDQLVNSMVYIVKLVMVKKNRMLMFRFVMFQVGVIGMMVKVMSRVFIVIIGVRVKIILLVNGGVQFFLKNILIMFVLSWNVLNGLIWLGLQWFCQRLSRWCLIQFSRVLQMIMVSSIMMVLIMVRMMVIRVGVS